MSKQETLESQSGSFLMGSKRRGAQRAVAADTQPPTKPQTLSIFSGTKHVCGMRSPTQLPLEQEQEEWGAGKWGSQSLLLANASLRAPKSQLPSSAPLHYEVHSQRTGK